MLNNKNFMNIAEEISKASNCVSKQVGAILVKDGRILSTGYNGTPKGYINCCDHWEGKYTKEHHEWSKKYEIHAEMNALIWAARKGISVENSVLYCTFEPCNECTKNLIASGVKRIYFKNHYEYNVNKETGAFLEACNIEKIKV